MKALGYFAVVTGKGMQRWIISFLFFSNNKNELSENFTTIFP